MGRFGPKWVMAHVRLEKDTESAVRELQKFIPAFRGLSLARITNIVVESAIACLLKRDKSVIDASTLFAPNPTARKK